MEGANHAANQKDLVEYIAKALASDADAVRVAEEKGERGPVISLKVADGDIGKVIGKYGRIAKAIRTVMSASASPDSRRYALDIAD